MLKNRVLVARPEPPAELNPAEAEDWREIVAAMPANWFPRETRSLLVGLCHLNQQLRDVSAEIARKRAAGESLIQDYKEQREIIHHASSLSSKMRLTQGSSFSGYHKKQKLGTRDTSLKGKEGSEVPWDKIKIGDDRVEAG